MKEPRPRGHPPCSQASVKLRSPVSAFFGKIAESSRLRVRRGHIAKAYGAADEAEPLKPAPATTRYSSQAALPLRPLFPTFQYPYQV